jgi:arylsulfatase A-like enzyme
MQRFSVGALLLVVLLAARGAGALAAERPNVLFIAIDDLNHWVGYIGRNPQAKTPHIDALAAQGVAFTNAHCSAPACNPSRAALMAGLRPSTTGVYDNGQPWQEHIDKSKTLTTQFLNAGYSVYGAGKIYHADFHRPGEWTEYFVQKRDGHAKTDPSAKDNGVGGIRFKPLTNDSHLADEAIVDYGVQKLGEKHDKPFFLAVGIHKPHMPWNVPKRYYDMFPLDEIELPPTQQDDLADVPAGGRAMAKADEDHAMMVESGRWKEAVQAYLATIAYTDELVGRLLDAYDKSPQRDNTIVVLWGDHGWHLGEKEHWRKFALWEEATRVPYAWIVPGVTKPGGKSAAPVDLMSIYPTLCELCDIPVPAHVEGADITPLLEDPQSAWDEPALTTFRRQNHAVRTERWRYIRYADGGEELYDHQSDPHEWKNLARDPQFAGVCRQLRKLLPSVDAPSVPMGKAAKRKGRQAAAGGR